MGKRIKCSDISYEEIVEACLRFHSGQADTPDIAFAHKYPVKVILAKMQRMVEKGLLEYGVSLRTAWVVKKEEEEEKPYA